MCFFIVTCFNENVGPRITALFGLPCMFDWQYVYMFPMSRSMHTAIAPFYGTFLSLAFRTYGRDARWRL